MSTLGRLTLPGIRAAGALTLVLARTLRHLPHLSGRECMRSLVLYGYQFIIGQHVDLLVLWLLGAALGATDPIGIKGVLSSVRAPHH